MADKTNNLFPDDQSEIIDVSLNHKHKNAISKKLIAIIITIMVALAITSSLAIFFFTTNTILKEKEQELSAIASMTAANIDLRIPGDYSLQGDTSYRLYKGDTDITTMLGLISETSDRLGVEISLIYKDTRILTTIVDGTGKTAVGLGLAPQINNALATSSKGVFFENTLIGQEEYFSYYYPLFNSDGSYAGAIECCSPLKSIMPTVKRNIVILNLIILIATVLLLVLISNFNREVNRSINKLIDFTSDAASGNDAALLDATLLRRKDEFGTIATAVLDMHRSMRDMMDKDALTKLYNRRSANRKLDLIISHYTTNGTPYCISIGDIDYFKKINDTYGHDAGDVVLQAVATILQNNMKKNGFVARWGGEEFLLAFDKTDLDTAVSVLEVILDEIRALTIDYEGNEIKLTMSFGVTCNPELSRDAIINEADERLYHSKENGRNRITAALPESSVNE